MPSTPARRYLPAIALLLLGSLGIAAAWVLLAAAFDRMLCWMAVVAALDAALMLRLGRFPQGKARVVAGLLATMLSIAAATWGVAAAHIGRPLGLLPWESLTKMGGEFGWLLIQLSHGAGDIAWLAAGLLAAIVTCR